jgi:hypothetical protein
MNPTVYNTALVLHIVGITLMGGATFIEYITFRQFWKTVASDRNKAMVVWETISNQQKLMGFGMLIIIMSGVTMMYYLHEAWGAQLWFRIKFGLLIIVIFNGLGVRRVLGSRLNKKLTLAGPVDSIIALTTKIRSNILIVHIIQLLLFLTIFVLSIFKFT